jgi:hypothetical protein
MARGGKREGAGRKAGSLTVRNRQIADKAAEEGVTPLDVLLENMRFYHGAAESALKRLLEGLATPEQIVQEHDPQAPDPSKPPPNVIDAFRVMLALKEKASKEAERAAPFMHPRITPVERKPGDGEEVVPLSERLAAYEREEAIAESAGKVVDLAKKKAGK